MSFLQLFILSIVQGFAELLPVSSSAHVIMAEKWMGLDPTSPELTMLLVMLHTGTMFAVIVYFWASWRATYFSSASALRSNVLLLAAATALTGIVGFGLLKGITHFMRKDAPGFEIEHLFGNAKLMAAALAAAGVLIIVSSRLQARQHGTLSIGKAMVIGAVQGLCLPFRGFSRSGATISAGIAMGVPQRRAEEFSFALAVVLTPAVLAKEGWRFYQAVANGSLEHLEHGNSLLHLLGPSLLGMLLSFLAGLLALRWLSRWLEQGRWYFFGAYCLLASLVVLYVG
ncbi:undecaprenyl-diphosphate phosphatase [Janthinobacterium sp. BJB304]|uniref:undecaprenyl-diphosphate phosphatase n=1 Tax=Janthinobacterium sp. BJB304 TaxID=1572871 RepID=UPI000C0F84C7|nr:undecaprenyl-diphosphate phosphatase [Janthinobacterium sp. BJB304]PHV35827.1 UDP-diphosphatase [Janthinobacterium sp. BJB304]